MNRIGIPHIYHRIAIELSVTYVKIFIATYKHMLKIEIVILQALSSGIILICAP
jgi:hypothetical protein